MEIKTHILSNSKIAEVLSEEVLITTPQDGLDLLGNLYYQDFDKIIISEKHLAKDFFDLKNGVAGEILQKFSNYRVKLAIVGDFVRYDKKSIRDFISESNRNGHINFVGSVSEALAKLSAS